MFKVKKQNLFLFLLALLLALASLYYYKKFIFAEDTLFSRLKGKILLQVEKHGEAWYLNPTTQEAYYLGRPADAFGLMKNLGVGISNENIKKIPIAASNLNGPDADGDGLSDIIEDSLGTDKNNPDSDNDGYDDKEEILNKYNPLGAGRLPIDNNFSKKQGGKILLQAEQNGEAWYVNPNNNKRYFLGRPSDAFNVMRSLGLGISNKDLEQIPKFQEKPNLAENNVNPSQEDPQKLNYRDEKLQFAFNYPKDWRIIKYPDYGNIIFLGDYEKKPLKEKKGLILISYIQTKKEIQTADFKIASKPGAEKLQSNITTLNGNKALEEIFEYSNTKAYEITTDIQKNPKEFFQLTLITSGNRNYYQNIYNEIIKSIKFN